MARWLLGGTFAVISGLAAAEAPAPSVSEPLRIIVGSPSAPTTALRPLARPAAAAPYVPPAFWDGEVEGADWTHAAMQAIAADPDDLRDVVPADIDAWCPGYTRNPDPQRAAFWVGTLSLLARHESGFRERAVGGGGAWTGLLQISTATARHMGCTADTGEALKDGEANVACAVRILSRQVARDGVVAENDRGVAAQWGPMRRESVREEVRDWLSEQPYCRATLAVVEAPRPEARPDTVRASAG